MSISYSLSVVTEMTPEQVAEIIRSNVDLRQTGTADFDGRGVTVGIVEVREMSREVFEEEYGIVPSVSIVMHFHPSDGYDDGKRNIADVVAEVLLGTDGDAVLLRNREDLMLRRSGGQVTIVNGWGEWLTPRLAEASVRYEQRRTIVPAA